MHIQTDALSSALAFLLVVLASGVAAFASDEEPFRFQPPLPTQGVHDVEFTGEFKLLIVNLGEIPQSSARESFYVRLKNSSPRQLPLEHIKTSCGCLAAIPDNKKIAAGESELIFLSISPSSEGDFSKHIGFFSSNEERSSLLLRVQR